MIDKHEIVIDITKEFKKENLDTLVKLQIPKSDFDKCTSITRTIELKITYEIDTDEAKQLKLM